MQFLMETGGSSDTREKFMNFNRIFVKVQSNFTYERDIRSPCTVYREKKKKKKIKGEKKFLNRRKDDQVL